MKILLLHNPTAGDGEPSPKRLQRLLRDAGHDVVYQSTKAKDVADVFEQPADLVAVAGGDGTFAKVAKRLAGRGIPIALLPLGTANNIATTLGLRGTVKELIHGWRIASRRRFDVGLARGPWGESRFVEGVGIGVFTEAMCLADTHEEQGRSPPADRARRFARDLRLLHQTAASLAADPSVITIDDEEIADPILLCEVMNIRSLGPQLTLTPDADPGDGFLDVLCATAYQRETLVGYLANREPNDCLPPPLPVRRARRIRITTHARRARIDDEIELVDPPAAAGPWTLEIRIEPGAIEVLV